MERLVGRESFSGFSSPGDMVSSSSFDSVETRERKHFSVLLQERRKQAVCK